MNLAKTLLAGALALPLITGCGFVIAEPISEDEQADGGGSAGCVRNEDCVAPPADTCQTCGTNGEGCLNAYADVGLCNEGRCEYPAAPVLCELGCDGDGCAEEQQVDCRRNEDCVSPPEDSCRTCGSNGEGCLNAYADVGQCNEGRCEYQAAPVLCEYGCDGNRCAEAVECDQDSECTDPPASECWPCGEAGQGCLNGYGSQGVCQDHHCEYPAAPILCEHGCDGNRCAEPGLCGNALLDEGELCDDGNTVDGDGCSADCRSVELCGNGYLDVVKGEVCDDGNNVSGDGCSADCRSVELCGNGYLDVVKGEVCDDGNNVNGDGCSADCRGT